MATAIDFLRIVPTQSGDTGMTTAVRTGDSSGPEHYAGRDAALVRLVEASDVTLQVQRALGTDGIDAFLAGLGTQMAAALPSDVLVTFEILGEGGGVWTLHTEEGGHKVRPGRAIWADSVLTCTVPRFLDLVTGAVDVQQAFFDGTVQVEGDVGLLLRLHKALPQAV